MVTLSLLVANVGVYLYQFFLNERLYERFVLKFAFIPVEYTHFTELHPYLALPFGVSVVTSMFLHGGFMHLAGNMLYLWIFGNNVEDYLGHVKFLVFYLISGVAAVALFTATSPNSQTPLIGASGAIAGVLGAYLVLYPQARIHALVFLGFFIQTVRLPAKLLLGFWFVMQVVYGLPGLALGGSGGGVAWFAHVGGFAFGYLYFKLTGKQARWDYYA